MRGLFFRVQGVGFRGKCDGIEASLFQKRGEGEGYGARGLGSASTHQPSQLNAGNQHIKYGQENMHTRVTLVIVKHLCGNFVARR